MSEARCAERGLRSGPRQPIQLPERFAGSSIKVRKWSENAGAAQGLNFFETFL